LQGKRLHIIILALVSVVLSSCNINRFVPDGKYLVKSNSVVIEQKKTEISKSKLSSYIALKPYKSSLQTNIPTWFYYKSERRPNNKVWKWMNEKFGKEPVYYEKAEADRSSQQMMRYLDKVGYFHSQVTHEVSTRHKRAKVKYIVDPAVPYRVNKMEYIIEDSLMERFLMRDSAKFALHKGDIYNEFSLRDEREMMTERLKNSGYYYFKRDNILYEVDSNFLDHSLSVTMRVTKNKLSHKRYNINSISIYPDFSIFKMIDRPKDTVSLTVEVGRRKWPNTLDFYYYDKPRVKAQTFPRSILILQNMPYNLRSVTGTYQNLSNFRLFNNVNITFDTVPGGNDSLNLLDCKITMQQNDVHSVTLQTEGTNSDGDLGIKGGLSYTNKNLFHGAETFQFSIRGGLEAQRLVRIEGEESDRKFNTWELGITTNLEFPKFLSPIALRNFARDYQPTTTIGLGYNMQIKYYYSRYILSASFGYDWKTNTRLKQTFLPVYFNSVKIDKIKPEFQAFLDAETNQRKKDQYTNHMIFGTRYSFVYNTQNINKTGSFVYFRADLESSGNVLSLFNNTKLMTEKDGHHELFGIRYAQYVRGGFDVRQHVDLGRETWLVFRQFLGLGLPYGNSVDLPFERSFYAGGANSLRGWSYHGVGPGGYVPTGNDIEQIGDLQLELNAELRFPVYNIFNGAIFVDAGNVWTYNANQAMPNGEFKFNTFYKQIALDAGVGVRIDVSFLIIRVDLAYAMRNPYSDVTGNYWRFGQGGNMRLNFGIGYPF
jgi:outer membrane protein assembly factor BamA